MNIISIKELLGDTDVVSDVTYMRQSVTTRVVVLFLWHDVIRWITAKSYDKNYLSGVASCGFFPLNPMENIGMNI